MEFRRVLFRSKRQLRDHQLLLGSPVRHVLRTARAQGEEPHRIQPGIYRGSGADLPTGEGIVGRGRRYRPSPPARPALTCPVAGLDFPPVLNSTEPAEIMYGKRSEEHTSELQSLMRN